jgi:putative mRNA 3-end processing factor
MGEAAPTVFRAGENSGTIPVMSKRAQRLTRALRWEAGGVRLVGTPLWMDSRSAKDLCVISHAHADHVGEHTRTLATSETLALLGRTGKSGVMPCRYQRPFELGPLRLELLPSGHLPGAAQVLIEHKGQRILYTSDVYDGRQRFAKPLVMTTCDLMLIEATYGTPRHRFPSREDAAAMLREEVKRALAKGRTPLLLIEGSLGRAQEVLAELGEDGHKLVASESVVHWCTRYRELGLELPRVRLYGGRPERGSVLVYPMRSRGLEGFKHLKGLMKIACTGQAGETAVARRLGVDRVVPFVDHADFDGLIRIAEACRPSKVLTVFGYPEILAQELRDRGHCAEPLTEAEQLILDL